MPQLPLQRKPMPMHHTPISANPFKAVVRCPRRPLMWLLGYIRATTQVRGAHGNGPFPELFQPLARMPKPCLSTIRVPISSVQDPIEAIAEVPVTDVRNVLQRGG